MRTHQADIAHQLTQRGVIRRRDHPELARAMERLIAKGVLRPVLPGVYAPALETGRFTTRVAAVMAAYPDAVLIRRAAAKVSFWPSITADTVACSVRAEDQVGFVFSRQPVPPELVVESHGIRYTTPALTALDLCRDVGGDGIDNVLRTRAATLGQLHLALELTRGRRGSPDRRQLLLDSRDQPWSTGERDCHRLLRAAGITGWRANVEVWADGARYYLDVGFAELKVAIEIDGLLHRDDLMTFETDRTRQNALVLDGWLVLRFTTRMLADRPGQVIASVVRALAERGKLAR